MDVFEEPKGVLSKGSGARFVIIDEVGEVARDHIGWSQVGHGDACGFYYKCNHWRSFKQTGV